MLLICIATTTLTGLPSWGADMDELIRKRDAIDIVTFECGKWEGLAKEITKQIKALPPVKPKNGTLVIPLNDSDFKSVKRIMLDNKPWCRMFYEEGGEAHWIKKYTPDDGEIYGCDNCGVEWQFNDGGPEENEAFYCPKCGFEMKRGEVDG